MAHVHGMYCYAHTDTHTLTHSLTQTLHRSKSESFSCSSCFSVVLYRWLANFNSHKYGQYKCAVEYPDLAAEINQANRHLERKIGNLIQSMSRSETHINGNIMRIIFVAVDMQTVQRDGGHFRQSFWNFNRCVSVHILGINFHKTLSPFDRCHVQLKLFCYFSQSKILHIVYVEACVCVLHTCAACACMCEQVSEWVSVHTQGHKKEIKH